MSIKFRCWYCNRQYSIRKDHIGTTLICNCKNEIRVPKRDGGNCRIKTILDYLISFLVCSLGGAFLGLCLGILCVRNLRVIAIFSGVGLLVGALGGESGINWIGQKIRDRER